jgi:type VI protein secretion system component VasK
MPRASITSPQRREKEDNMPVWLTAGAAIALLAMMALVFVLILVYAITRPSGGDSVRYTIAAAVVALAVLVAVALFVLLMALADARGKPREKEKEGDRIRSIGTLWPRSVGST